MPGEHLHPQFSEALAIGRYNEEIVAHEFTRSGIPIVHTEGKNDFDFILPNGQTLEWKLDVRSQCTGNGAIEWPTILRGADYYGYTFTYARIYTYQQYKELYMRGFLPAGGMGDRPYDSRYVRRMGREGLPLYQFIRDWKKQTIH